jgi:hypothetical protein
MITSLGQQRPDMAPGCPEKFDLKFLAYAWRFHARERHVIEEMIATTTANAVRLQSDADIENFLDELTT